MNSFTKTTGIALALAAASLAGCKATGDAESMEAKDTSIADHVKCYGTNSCQGQNDCKTATNACKGQGSCKGLGFMKSTRTLCDEAGGKTTPS